KLAFLIHYLFSFLFSLFTVSFIFLLTESWASYLLFIYYYYYYYYLLFFYFLIVGWATFIYLFI
ncbi:MAG: hypothetical protein N7Q72_05360, partial [Spiroplasma sp. Tabriz.8]|nr:hypothetical protein [Spiroplasma sp. Tabriz.8]